MTGTVVAFQTPSKEAPDTLWVPGRPVSSDTGGRMLKQVHVAVNRHPSVIVPPASRPVCSNCLRGGTATRPHAGTTCCRPVPKTNDGRSGIRNVAAGGGRGGAFLVECLEIDWFTHSGQHDSPDQRQDSGDSSCKILSHHTCPLHHDPGSSAPMTSLTRSSFLVLFVTLSVLACGCTSPQGAGTDGGEGE